MKTQLILKTAVVAIASFGAFAFNGSNNANILKPFSIKNGDDCINILAGCSENMQGPDCEILYNGTPTTVYDLQCTVPVKHDNSSYVEWDDI